MDTLSATLAQLSEQDIASITASMQAWRDQMAAEREDRRNAPVEVPYQDDEESPLPLPWPVEREIWRPVPGTHGYRVSTLGRVQSFVIPGTDRARNKPRVLKPKDHKGYSTVTLVDQNGSTMRAFVHRLVLAAFVGESPEGRYDTRHLDGSRNNNNVNNLCYGSCKENSEDRRRHEKWRADDLDWDASVFWQETLEDTRTL